MRIVLESMSVGRNYPVASECSLAIEVNDRQLSTVQFEVTTVDYFGDGGRYSAAQKSNFRRFISNHLSARA